MFEDSAQQKRAYKKCFKKINSGFYGEDIILVGRNHQISPDMKISNLSEAEIEKFIKKDLVESLASYLIENDNLFIFKDNDVVRAFIPIIDKKKFMEGFEIKDMKS